MYNVIHTLIYVLEQKGNAVLKNQRGSFLLSEAVCKLVAPGAPFLLMFGFSPAGWAVSLLSSNK